MTGTLSWRTVRWPLRRNPSTGIAASWRTTVELHLSLAGHSEGWGEAAPLPGLHVENCEDVVRRLPDLARLLQTLDCDNPASDAIDALERGVQQLELPPSLRWATAWALARALDWEPTRPGNSPDTCELLPGPPREWVAQLKSTRDAGCWKLKLGRVTLEEEAAALIDLGARLPNGGELRLDANRHFSLDALLAMKRMTPELNPAWIEEPLADTRQLQEWLDAGGWPLALDESLDSPGIHLDELRPRVAAWVLKPQVLGLRAVLGWMSLARSRLAAGLAAPACIISSSFESPRGMAPLRTLASLAPGLPRPGLGTDSWFESEEPEEGHWSTLTFGPSRGQA